MTTPAPPSYHADSTVLPAAPGAYVLLVGLAAPLSLSLPGRPAAILAAGRYLYCGSARGPGGIRARVGRHMRADRKPRWHIDRLTAAGRLQGALTFPDGCECDLVTLLADMPFPLPGFGSSDCRRCTSHLLAWPPASPLPATWATALAAYGSPAL